MSYSGFNGFNQISSTLKVLLQTSEHNTDEDKDPILGLSLIAFDIPEIRKCTISLSWSYNVIFKGDAIIICGHIEKQNGGILKIQTPRHYLINQVSCSRKHLLCVTEDGALWQYSLMSQEWRELGPMLSTDDSSENEGKSQVHIVSCGETLTAVLTKSGDVYNMPSRLPVPIGLVVTDVVCGRAHMLMLTSNGQLLTVGEGSRGQQGHGSLEPEIEPRLVEGLAGLPVTAVACGGWHSCALTATGDLYTWGWNVNGQLGLKAADGEERVNVQASPLAVDFPDEDARVTQVACGSQHTVALLDDRTAWGTGWNAYGQLGLPGGKNLNCMTKIPTSKPVKEVICGPWGTLFRYID